MVVGHRTRGCVAALLIHCCSQAAALTLHLEPLSAPLAATSTAEVVWYRGLAYVVGTQEAPIAGTTTMTEAMACPPCEPEEAEEEFLRPPDPAFYVDIALVIFCITTAGMMAGCTMGILSLDPLTLKLKQLEGSPEDKRCAEAVLPVIASHHDLLVSLLLVNAAANEALPIFLDRLVDSTTAVLLSVTCVLVFGEILPSAIMTGPAQLKIAAALAPGVRALMLLTTPISWPMARCLDLVLGHHNGVTRFKKKEFRALVQMQARTKEAARAWRARTAENRPSAAALRPSYSAPEPLAVAAATAASTKALSPDLPKTPKRDLVRQLSGVLEKTRAERASQARPAGGEAKAPPPAAASQAANKTRKQLQFSAKRLLPAGGGAPAAAKAKAKEQQHEAVDEETEFTEDEVTILTAVFSLQSKRVVNLIEPGRNDWAHIRMVGMDARMDLPTMQLITQWGVSRLPIYSKERNNIRGIILIKEHLVLDPDDETPVSSLRLRLPCVMHPNTSMFDALNLFQTGHSHMALITESADDILEAWRTESDVPSHVVILGICTIEDVIEELIGEEVLDETDHDLERTLIATSSVYGNFPAPASGSSELSAPLLQGGAAYGV